MIKALFFDNDGVLVSTEHLYFQADQQVLQELGHSYSEDQYRQSVMVEGKGFTHLLTDLGFSEAAIKEATGKRNQVYFSALTTQDNRITGVESVLKTLSPQFIMMIVSASRREHFERIHEQTGFLQYFKTSFCREDYPAQKPYPDGYLKALQQSGVKPEESLVIEDSPRGIVAAHAAGIKAVAIPHGPTESMDFSQADFVLNNITELPNLINQLNHAR